MRYVWAEPKEYHGWIVFISDGDNTHEIHVISDIAAEEEMRGLVAPSARIEPCENCESLIAGPATLDNPCPSCGYWPGTEGFTEIAKSIDPGYLKE